MIAEHHCKAKSSRGRESQRRGSAHLFRFGIVFFVLMLLMCCSEEADQTPSKRPRRAQRIATEAERLESSLLIQKWWKGHIMPGSLTRKIVGNFFLKGISLETAKEIRYLSQCSASACDVM